MSAGYAARLSEYSNKGVVGLPENYDSKRSLLVKLKKLAEWVENSQHLVVLTGAGISTSAGIPDFRGPNGIWTIEKEQKQAQKGRKRKRPQASSSSPPPTPMEFGSAKPTLTHRAITKLAQVGKIKYCITQNVDGLHRRSGLSRNHHAALHGCAFTEKCQRCSSEFFRDADVGGMSFQPTGNKCESCHSGLLIDTLLDWEDPLPEDDLERAEAECDQADLVLCLGTSLRIEPAGSLPLRAKRFVVVNLQRTAKDDEAAMIIQASVDNVMENLMQQLGYSHWRDEPEPPIERQWSPDSGVTF